MTSFSKGDFFQALYRRAACFPLVAAAGPEEYLGRQTAMPGALVERPALKKRNHKHDDDAECDHQFANCEGQHCGPAVERRRV
jgi:hypothetical protein